jgi:hypothetical protein
MKTGVCHLQKKFFGVQPFIAANKTKKLKAKVNALQEKWIEFEAIKI